MKKVIDLAFQYIQNGSARKTVLDHYGWLPYEFVNEDTFKACLENFKKEHPDISTD